MPGYSALSKMQGIYFAGALSKACHMDIGALRLEAGLGFKDLVLLQR